MKQFFQDLLGRIPLARKFLILGVIAITLTAIPFSFYFIESQADITKAQLEDSGIKPVIQMLRIVQLAQRHRGMSSLFLSGDNDIIDDRIANEKEIADAIAAMDAFIKRDFAEGTPVWGIWDTGVQKWKELEKQVAAKQLDRPQSIKAHSALIKDYFNKAVNRMADFYGMSLDSKFETYWMVRASMYATPALTEALGKLRAEGGGLLTQKQASLEDRLRLSALTDTADYHLEDRIMSDYPKIFGARPDIKTKLEPMLNILNKEYDDVMNIVNKEIINAPQMLSYPRLEYFNAMTKLIDTAFDLNNMTLGLLSDELHGRVTGLRNTQLVVSFSLLALFLLGTLFSIAITRGITGPVTHLVDVMDKLAMGDSTVRANLYTFDEIGVLARQFDLMVDQREAVSTKIQHENEQLNNSVIELMQAVAKLADKDLTVKVPVAEDITGLVADALNLLTQETSGVLIRVVSIASNVAQVSRQVKSQSDNVIDVASEEKREVEQAAAELSQASEVMQGIAKLALSCNQAAEQAINNTDKAQETVLGTVEGITTIRDTIRETEKRIKRLGERSQEIGGVVNIINGIAERTHILAVNASMHAASAGEAGRGFAVVANEVQKLAENAREATLKISALVNNIQLETADTVTTMNDAISQVVRGTVLAQQAGSEMRETRDTTANLVQLVRRIADGSTAQAHTSMQLRERALHIQKSTEQTYEQLQAQGVQTDQLVGFSEELVQAVGVFTLPKAAGA